MRDSSYSKLRARLWVRKLFNPFLEKASFWLAPAASLQAKEVLYQNIVHRDLGRLELDLPVYPVRSAATYSYLYLLLRTVQEIESLRILELGSGLSTVLLERLRTRFSLQLTSLEHDEHWVELIRSQGVESIVHSGLVEGEILGHPARIYDSRVLDANQRFNVLLVDGPRRSRRRSRWTALEYIESWLEEEFMIIFDDAERPGEIDTISAALRLLDQRGIVYGTHLTRSVNSQFVIATQGFQAALHF
jgi:predicted O-methyltransferase YrrM